MPGLPADVVQELADRALAAERNCVCSGSAVKSDKPLAIRVKVATQPTFTRYVFTMPDAANVVPESGDGKLTLTSTNRSNGIWLSAGALCRRR